MDERPVGEITRFHVSMVIKCKKKIDEITLTFQLQEYQDIIINLIE